MAHSLFHLAFPVSNIPDTKRFYADGLGCQVGRENAASLILNLRGNQLVAHVTRETLTPQQGVYPRHFGLIFTDEAEWRSLLERAEQQQLHFYQSSKCRFLGTALEHSTFFLEDPFFNLLEFKYYRHFEAIFGEKAFVQIGDVES
ncbi:glyoxalase [Phormidium sp. CLA17]|uniref:VOC family protein n=1 Tax=Leptolyngbya sp. Cla-17 TaxID=2803751 RepID=UPI001490BC6D|nr:VOC family protein [Leptolyngbya sp. Cla-17]MBM0743753.1 glyoxalase [Leptolyngbya sp. Cla-17]